MNKEKFMREKPEVLDRMCKCQSSLLKLVERAAVWEGGVETPWRRSFLARLERQPPFAMKPGEPVATTGLSLVLV